MGLRPDDTASITATMLDQHHFVGNLEDANVLAHPFAAAAAVAKLTKASLCAKIDLVPKPVYSGSGRSDTKPKVPRTHARSTSGRAVGDPFRR